MASTSINFVRIVAMTLVIVALPLSTSLTVPTPAQAQVTNPSTLPSVCAPSTAASSSTPTTSTSCYVAARLSNGKAVAFNPVGENDSATFVCDALTAGLYGLGGSAPGPTPGPTLAPGCYNLQISVNDLVGGVPSAQSATCGNQNAAVIGSTVDCSGVASPICPVGFAVAAVPSPTTPCTASGITGYALENTATVTINPGAPHHYRIDFHGYIPTTSAGSCPIGTLRTGLVLTSSYGFPPTSTSLPATSACEFTISVDKYYVLAGATILKTGVDCTQEPPIAGGGLPPPPFPPGSSYNCINGTLFVQNIPIVLGPSSPSPLTVIALESGRCTPGTSLLLVGSGHRNGTGSGIFSFADGRQSGSSIKLSANRFLSIIRNANSAYLAGTGTYAVSGGGRVIQRITVPFEVQVVDRGLAMCRGLARVQTITGYDSGLLSVAQARIMPRAG